MDVPAFSQGLEYWADPSHWPCPSCGNSYIAHYKLQFWKEFDGYNSNSFTYNMLARNPAGSINPPPEPKSPGYSSKPGKWYQ